MRKVLLIIIALLIHTYSGFGQNFTLNDTDFQIGDTLRKNILFSFNNPYVLPESFPFLDSLVDFIVIQNISCLKIESNTDIRGSAEYNDTLSDRRAKAVSYYLYSKGISPNIIITFGMGEKAPVISEEEINQMGTNEEREKAHALNRQTIFRIVEIR